MEIWTRKWFISTYFVKRLGDFEMEILSTHFSTRVKVKALHRYWWTTCKWKSKTRPAEGRGSQGYWRQWPDTLSLQLWDLHRPWGKEKWSFYKKKWRQEILIPQNTKVVVVSGAHTCGWGKFANRFRFNIDICSAAPGLKPNQYSETEGRVPEFSICNPTLHKQGVFSIFWW